MDFWVYLTKNSPENIRLMLKLWVYIKDRYFG
jgi:hypothetical protein